MVTEKQPLRTFLNPSNFTIGTAVRYDPLLNSAFPIDTTYGQVLSQQFNRITPETEMKWKWIHPSATVYDFTQPDALVSYAQANNMVVRGHTLVWGNALPTYLTSGSYTRTQLLDIMEDHITTVMTHYQGQVREWDVVNEAFNDDGTLTANFWYNGIGADYIDYAFQFARAADPNCKLYYNETRVNGINTKSTAMYNMIVSMQQRGIPIDGVGIQGHTNLTTLRPTMSDFAANLARFGALGLETAVTEADVDIQQPTSMTLDQRLQDQNVVYSSMIHPCLYEPSCKSFTVWGFTDKYTWLPTASYPNLYDASYVPKKAYYGVRYELYHKAIS